MRIGNLEVQPGEKKTGFLQVNGSEYALPIIAICGGEGAVTLVTAGIHNAEYVGIQAAIELGRELEPAEVSGTLVILPIVNVSGFARRTMSLTYEDNKNLNREFPGKTDGTVADKICSTVVKELFCVADYYIDLHSGDGYEQLNPYVYYVGAVEEKVRSRSYEMARCVDVKYIVESQCTTGGAYNYASAMGIPSILIERGGMGAWSREDVDLDKMDVKRILRLIYQGEKPKEPEKVVFREAVYENAPIAGCWYPFKKAGEKFQKDAVLGEIRNFFGQVLYVCRAKESGMILYQTGSLNVLENGPMVAYGVLRD